MAAAAQPQSIATEIRIKEGLLCRIEEVSRIIEEMNKVPESDMAGLETIYTELNNYIRQASQK